MKQYLDLLQDILTNGEWKEPAREGMPRTKEVFGRMLKFDLQQGFPLITTKKMHTKGIVAELLWFLSGSTNVADLHNAGSKIWDADAYKYYIRYCKQWGIIPLTKEEWINELETSKFDMFGKCGRIYGHQWRNYDNKFDQIKNVINSIKENPNSRYHVVTAWNPIDFLLETDSAALPACHMMFQFSVRGGKYLDLTMLQRSCDTFLGLPYNIASYALLIHIIADICNLKPGEFTWFGNSVHLYENHMSQVNEILTREPYELCKLYILEHHNQPEEYQISDFEFAGYESHPALKAPLSVGI